MIKVTVTENSALLAELEFDAVNVLHYDGAVAVISRDVMRSAKPSLWHRVAHAAAWVAETGDLGALLEAQAQHPIDILLQRLQTGWQPTPDDIEAMEIPQFTLSSWKFAGDTIPYGEIELPLGPADFIIGDHSEGRTEICEVIWIDAGLRWALCQHAFVWLQHVNE